MFFQSLQRHYLILAAAREQSIREFQGGDHRLVNTVFIIIDAVAFCRRFVGQQAEFVYSPAAGDKSIAAIPSHPSRLVIDLDRGKPGHSYIIAAFNAHPFQLAGDEIGKILPVADRKGKYTQRQPVPGFSQFRAFGVGNRRHRILELKTIAVVAVGFIHEPVFSRHFFFFNRRQTFFLDRRLAGCRLRRRILRIMPINIEIVIGRDPSARDNGQSYQYQIEINLFFPPRHGFFIKSPHYTIIAKKQKLPLNHPPISKIPDQSCEITLLRQLSLIFFPWPSKAKAHNSVYERCFGNVISHFVWLPSSAIFWAVPAKPPSGST